MINLEDITYNEFSKGLKSLTTAQLQELEVILEEKVRDSEYDRKFHVRHNSNTKEVDKYVNKSKSYLKKLSLLRFYIFGKTENTNTSE